MTKKLEGDALALRNWKRFGRLMMREVKRLEKELKMATNPKAAWENIDMDTEHEGLPVQGYKPQGQKAVALVNEHKIMEEHLLRRIEDLFDQDECDSRWLNLARTHFEQGFMALNRAVFQPQRIELPEDSDAGSMPHATPDQP